MSRVCVVGAGAWGTALAVAAHRAGCEVSILAHEDEIAATINDRRENLRYLPGVVLDSAIAATAEADVVSGADCVLLACSAQRLRAVVAALAPRWRGRVPAVICAKGVEEGTGALLTEVLDAVLPGIPQAVLSGPTFAREVADGLPTAATVACREKELAVELVALLASRRFRLYAGDDPIGVQVGGAVKNVIAIAAGIVEGRRLGDNARAGIITRGLAEMARLADALGARPQTLMGLAGLGDLTLTCSARQSRNFSLGVSLAEGRSLDYIVAQRRGIAEGVFTARSVRTLAGRHGVEMPICEAVHRVLHEGADLDSEIERLLTRPLTMEHRC